MKRTRRVPLEVIPVTPFGKYKLIGKLGHGGMSEVFLAFVTGPADIRKIVVIKRLHHQLEEESEVLVRFLEEARLAARLNHGNIAQCFEVGDVDGSHFITMEYLEGQGLDRIWTQCVREGHRMPVPITARIFVDVLDGLQYAHELKDFDGLPLKIVHGDISPSNVFISYDGIAKILDFGIANASKHLLEKYSGGAKRKIAYSAPEQARGGVADHRSDIWSSGVLLWEALVNRGLFRDSNDLALRNKLLSGHIPDLAKIVPNIPERLNDLTRKALSREVENRYQTAHEMKRDLEQAFIDSDLELASRAEVAAFVRGLFADVIEQHRDVLRVCLADSSAPGEAEGAHLRVPEGTPADLRLTPVQCVFSVEPASEGDAAPSEQGVGSSSRDRHLISEQSTGGEILGQAQKSTVYAGKTALFVGLAAVAVVSLLLLILWFVVFR